MGLFKKKRSEELLKKIGLEIGESMIKELSTKQGVNKTELYMLTLEMIVRQQKKYGKFNDEEIQTIMIEADKKLSFLNVLFGE